MENKNPAPATKQAEASEDQTIAPEEKRSRILDPNCVYTTQDLVDLLGTLDALRDSS